MHERSITESIIKQVLEECSQFSRIQSISLKVGTLTTYAAHPIQYYFDTFKAKYPVLRHAILHIQGVPGTVYCDDCSKETECKEIALLCPLCGGSSVRIIQGKDVIIGSVKGE